MAFLGNKENLKFGKLTVNSDNNVVIFDVLSNFGKQEKVIEYMVRYDSNTGKYAQYGKTPIPQKLLHELNMEKTFPQFYNALQYYTNYELNKVGNDKNKNDLY